MTALGWYGVFLVAAGIYLFFLTAANVVFFVRNRRIAPLADGPMVSVLIPARNEEDRIRPGLEAILRQDYGNYEVVVLDDNSTDGTWGILEESKRTSDRLRLAKGRPLPEGWNGKPYALHQLIGEARGDILLFMDADMTPSPGFVGWSVAQLERLGADSFSGYPRHTCATRGEYAIVPIIYLVTIALLPVSLILRSRWRHIAHAMGQVICFRREVLEAIGGYESVRQSINEDVQISRAVKARGFRHAFLDVKDHLRGNMYNGMGHMLEGLERVLFEYFDRKVYPLAVMSVFLLAVFVAPAPVLAAALAAGWAGIGWAALGYGLIFAAWALALWDRRMPWWSPPVFPFTFGVIIWLAWRAIVNNLSGKAYQWKGRSIR